MLSMSGFGVGISSKNSDVHPVEVVAHHTSSEGILTHPNLQRSSLGMPIGSTTNIRPRPDSFAKESSSEISFSIRTLASRHLTLPSFLAVTALGCLLCLLPVFFTQSVRLSGKPQQSLSVLLAAVTALAVAAPITVDMIIEMCGFHAKNSQWTPRAMLIISVIFPALVVLSQRSDPTTEMLLISSLFIQLFLWTSATLTLLQHAAPVQVPIEWMFVILPLLASAYALAVSSALLPHSFALRVLTLITGTIYTLTFTSRLLSVLRAIAIKYSLTLMTIFSWSSKLSLDDFSLFVTALLSICLLFSNIINTFIHTHTANVQISQEQISAYLLLHTLFLALLACLDNRSYKLKCIRLENDLEIKRTFVRYVSHEVRTPLNTIGMGLNLVLDELQEAQAKLETIETVNLLKESCSIATEILNELLLYEKIESGIMSLEMTIHRPTPFIETTLRPFQLAVRAKGLTLDCLCEMEPGSTMWGICVDESKMAQVLRNFISNAIKFTPTGGVITVCTRFIKKEGLMLGSAMCNVLRIEVKDSGFGISAENQRKVFNEIVQFHANKQQGGGGSGLGLWISKKIVELHSGKVGLFSEGEGKGSTFFVELPLHEIEEERPSEADIENGNDLVIPSPRGSIRSIALIQSSSVIAPMGEAEAEQGDSSALGHSLLSDLVTSLNSPHDAESSDDSITFPTKPARLRVLVVDDSALNRKVVMRSLEACGHVCSEAADGHDALVFFTTSDTMLDEIKVVLMDSNMPRMNGPDCARELRRRGYSGVILGLTGNGLPADIANFVELGADEVIVKPMSVEKFDEVISFVNKRRAYAAQGRLSFKKASHYNIKATPNKSAQSLRNKKA